jgi:DNA repair protein RecN (Recombination protein N)
MLSALKIQNYALIQNLDIEMKPGLNIITGETGTGKSIILGALGLIFGNRADSTSLLVPDKKCVIEGRFQIGAYDLKAFFKNNDLDWDEQTLLRREISPNGKSRAFINDTPVTLTVLKEFAESLVDIHSQHQTMKLSDPFFQIKLLDAYAGHKDLLEEYYIRYKEYRKTEKELKTITEQSASAKKEYDFNCFQLDELEKVRLVPGELDNLEEEFALLSNAETIKQLLRSAYFEISEDENSINNRLATVKKQLSSISTLNNRLQQIYKRIDDLLIETKDLSGDIDDYQESVSFDPERLAKTDERIRMINQLLIKHQLKSDNALLNYQEELTQKIKAAENLSYAINELELQLSSLKTELYEIAGKLSKNRKSQINNLESNLVGLLRQVGIPDAVVVIALKDADALNEQGRDQIEIQFSANKGVKPMPLTDVASGGELSRLMLCFKYILADSIFLPTIIFDEIDTGVSGEVAKKVGQIIKKLSSAHQVICITHLPQVAAMADHHYVVYKISGAEITVTNIRQLNKDERVEEIAKMIAGHTPSAVAIENARELLNY